jgi:hypothetical protein
MNLIIVENEVLSKSNKLTKPKQKQEVIFPTNVEDHHLLVNHKYTITHLKLIAKSFSLKTVGVKTELTARIHYYMFNYKYAIKIQSAFRRFLSNKYRSLVRFRDTVNDADFLTMEKLSDIPKTQFFSFKDKDGFMYGFDSLSFYQLTIVNKIRENPYNRAEFQQEIINDFNKLVRITKCLKLPLNTVMPEDEITPNQAQELKIVELFQTINSLGNYANYEWFMALDTSRLLRLFKELNDIWSYRSQISGSVKRDICPSTGDPFKNVHYVRMNQNSTIFVIREEILSIFENMVKLGINKDSQTLGSYYVLCALTLVSYDASIALPWLYQSVQYY